MSKEIELKLRFQNEHIPTLATYLDARCEALGEQLLENTYFDTPKAELAAHACALRIRKHGEGFEQTLKLSGTSDAGVMSRHEWNWPLEPTSSEPELNSAHLHDDALAQYWPRDIRISQLKPAFDTHFTRTTWLWHEDDWTCEVVIDHGQVVANERSMALCELEIELKNGQPECLWQVAQELCQQAPLWLSTISKAERGYQLAGMDIDWQAPTPNVPPALHEALPVWLQHEWQQLIRTLEHALWHEHLPAASAVFRHALALRHAPQWCGKVMKRQHTKELRQDLDEALSHLQILQDLATVRGLWQDAPVTSTYQQSAANLRADAELPLTLLRIAHWLRQQWPTQPCDESSEHFLARMQKERAALKKEPELNWADQQPRLVKLMLAHAYQHEQQSGYRQLGFMVALQGLLLNQEWMRVFDQPDDGPEFAHYVVDQLRRAQRQL